MARIVNINGEKHQVENNRATWVETTALALTECNGNACGDVSITWTGHGYDVRNNGNKRVRVRVRFTFGLQCLDWTSIDLNPGEVHSYGNGAYCEPVEANHI